MAELPLLSIIVPVYNIMEYLPRCVRSIQAQTYSDLEILLVDDGSTDGSGRLCEELAEQDGRIRVFHKKNGGSSSARNLGIANARGQYLGFVDSDDFIDADMYRRLYDALVSFGVSAVQIGRDEIDEQGHILPDICEPPREPEVIPCRDFLRELLLHRGDCSFCTKLLHRDLFDGRGFPEGVLNEDFHLLLELLPVMGSIVSLPGHLYHVFYRSGSNTRKEDRTVFSRVFSDSVDNADMAEELVRKDYPELKAIALRFGVFQRLEYLLHIPVEQMRRDNAEYRAVVGWLRRKLIAGLGNSILTGKNKVYMILFAAAPRGIRVLHRKLKRL